LPDASRPAYPREMKNRKLLGIVIGLIGVAVIVVAFLADYIGLSSGSSANSFGQRQMLLAGFGGLMVIAGAIVAFFRRP